MPSRAPRSHRRCRRDRRARSCRATPGGLGEHACTSQSAPAMPPRAPPIIIEPEEVTKKLIVGDVDAQRLTLPGRHARVVETAGHVRTARPARSTASIGPAVAVAAIGRARRLAVAEPDGETGQDRRDSSRSNRRRCIRGRCNRGCILRIVPSPRRTPRGSVHPPQLPPQPSSPHSRPVQSGMHDSHWRVGPQSLPARTARRSHRSDCRRTRRPHSPARSRFRSCRRRRCRSGSARSIAAVVAALASGAVGRAREASAVRAAGQLGASTRRRFRRSRRRRIARCSWECRRRHIAPRRSRSLRRSQVPHSPPQPSIRISGPRSAGCSRRRRTSFAPARTSESERKTSCKEQSHGSLSHQEIRRCLESFPYVVVIRSDPAVAIEIARLIALEPV